MKIITCASFYGSGSSALTDLVAEYSTVKDLTDYEFSFLYGLDGVSDLEYHLCECHDRNNSGHAIKRFKRLSDFNAGTFFNSRYEPFFDNKYKMLTDKYIESLIELKHDGWWFYDLYDRGKLYYYVKMEISHILRKLTKGKKDILPKEQTLCAHPSEEKFLKCTKDYVAALVRAANKENKPYLEVDQIVPSQNINRILRYFSDDIYVFVVDRDPRDIYASNRFYWKDHVCPTDDVNTFCDWFLYTRESGSKEKYDESRVCRLKFEDLIYKYDETVAEIERITGLNAQDHKLQFRKLNPKHSVNNTQVWKRHDIDSDIKVIESRLADYLYPFEEVDGNEIPGVVHENMKTF